MRNFFIFFIFLTFISNISFSVEESFLSPSEEIQLSLENSKKSILFYSESMWTSEASFAKYHYWIGRVHAYEDCLFIIKHYEDQHLTD